MATENIGFVNSREAAADLSSKQQYIVKLDSNGKVVLADGATAGTICGVLQNYPTSGLQAVYAFGGIAKTKLGGTVAAGDWLTSDANGKAITTTTDGNRTIGMALEAGVTGDLIKVQLHLGWFHNG